MENEPTITIPASVVKNAILRMEDAATKLYENQHDMTSMELAWVLYNAAAFLGSYNPSIEID